MAKNIFLAQGAASLPFPNGMGIPDLPRQGSPRARQQAEQTDQSIAASQQSMQIQAQQAKIAAEKMRLERQKFDEEHNPVGHVGDPKLDGQAYFDSMKKKDYEAGQLAEDFYKGRQLYPTGFAQKDPKVRAAQAEAAYAGRNLPENLKPSMLRNQIMFETRKDFEGKGKSAEGLQAANLAMQHADQLLDLAHKLPNGKIPALNTLINMTTGAVNPTLRGDLKAVAQQAQFFSTELERAWRGTGGSVAEIKSFQDNLSNADNIETIAAVLKGATHALGAKMDSAAQRYEQGTGEHKTGMDFFSPENRKRYERISSYGSGDPSSEYKASADGSTVFKMPPGAQDEMKSWFRDNKNTMTPQSYNAERERIDTKYGVPHGDYSLEEGAKTVAALKAGRMLPIIGDRNDPAKMTDLQGRAFTGVGKGIGGDLYVGAANAANDAALGIPEAILGKEGLEAANAEHPKSAFAGEVLGNVLGVGGLEGTIGKHVAGNLVADATRAKLANSLGSNAVAGGITGFNKADEGQGTMGAVGGTVVGAVGAGAGNLFGKGAKAFMDDQTSAAVRNLSGGKFDIPSGRSPLPADHITPPHFQTLDDAALTQEANLARNGIALHDDHANATTLADQARGELGSKLDDTIKSNRNAQVKFLNENIRSTSINSPEQIAAVQNQAERLYPTKPETLLQSGELRQLAAKAQAPQAPQILPKDVLQSRIDRIDDHISTPVMSEQGNVPAVNTTSMANLGLGRAEQSLQSFPFVHGAREAQMASMNINNSGRVLQKVGMNLPDNIRPGYDGNSQVHDLLDKAYEDIKPKVGGVVTPEFKATIAALRQKAYQTHSGQDAWNANIEPFVSKIEAKKTFDGHDYQELSTGMRSVSKILQDEPADINVQNVGHMAQNIRQANVNMVGTNNPTVGKDLGNLNDAWKHQLIIEDATRRAKSSNPDGIYSPQHLTMAVSKFDNSVGDGDLGRGKAFEQDYTRDAARVLGGTPASTSNPYHALMAGATLAGGGFVAHKLGQDGYATLASLPIGAIAAGYLPIGKQISKGISSGAIGQIAGKIAGPALDAARSIPVVGSKLPSNDDIISQILASMATKTLGN